MDVFLFFHFAMIFSKGMWKNIRFVRCYLGRYVSLNVSKFVRVATFKEHLDKPKRPLGNLDVPPWAKSDSGFTFKNVIILKRHQSQKALSVIKDWSVIVE